MFSFEHVMYFNLPRAFSISMFYTKINYTRIMNKYFLDLIGWVLVLAIGSIDLTIMVHTISTSLFML